MNIAYDARTLFHGATGETTYLRSLLRALSHIAPENQLHLYYREFDAEREAVAAHYPNVQTRGLSFPVGALWNHCALASHLASDGMDVLHAQYTLPYRAARPMVVTIHDITFRLFPQWIAPRPRRLMNFLIPLAARCASKVITCSQCSKDDMVRELGLPADKIVVTPYAAGSHFQPHDPQEAHSRVQEAYPELSNGFIAGIGLRGPRKNIGVVLRAILRLRARGAWPNQMKFAVAGTREQFPDEELAKLQDMIVFLGFVDEALLPYLFAAAQCSVYPSLYEGFGLPVLEAMACGCPVICSNRSSLPEVAGGAGAMLSPDDEEGWANVLESVLHDDNHRATLRSRGLERVREFSWEKCARQTLNVYQEVTGVSRG
jgi:glycosyltransferase involved in cell wall biosynthesis